MVTPALINRACPVCGSVTSQPLFTKEELKLVSCLECGMIFADNVRPEFASGEYYDTEAASYYLSEQKLESDYSPVRFVRELKLFRRHCPQGKVLDVGCSSGGFLHSLAHAYPGDYSFVGTDVSGPPLDYAEKRGIPVIRGDFLSLNLPEKSFDAVTFWAVLEHLINPTAFLERATALLKDSGRLFVLVPNMRSAAARLLGPKYRYVYPQHLNYFTRTTLVRLLSSHFEPTEVRAMHFNPIVMWQDWRNPNREVSNQERGKLLAKTTRMKTSRWLSPARMVYSGAEKLLGTLMLADNLAVVARLKG